MLETIPEVHSGNKVAQLFIINATITSKNDVAGNITATLNVDEPLSILDSPIKTIEKLSKNESVVVNWTINASRSGTIQASITTKADKILENAALFNITVDLTTLGIDILYDCGTDAYIRSDRPTKNYGADSYLSIRTNESRTNKSNKACEYFKRSLKKKIKHSKIDYDIKWRICMKTGKSPIHRALFWWNLDVIPSDIKGIVNAQIKLYAHGGASRENIIDVYRLEEEFEEGTGKGKETGDGATWYNYEYEENWTTPGGDYDNTTIWSSLAVGDDDRFYSWNVTELVKAWRNYTHDDMGVIFIARSDALKKFISMDSRERHISLRPRLEINYTI